MHAEIRRILELPNGAHFHRVDFHIHSYGASHDVHDPDMTPENIVETAHTEGLKVIAITDHNNISNVQQAITEGSTKNILVIPGVELSTPQGHLLCYFSTFDLLQSFFASLSLIDNGLPNSRCQNAITECLNLISKFRGCAILAL